MKGGLSGLDQPIPDLTGIPVGPLDQPIPGLAVTIIGHPFNRINSTWEQSMTVSVIFDWPY